MPAPASRNDGIDVARGALLAAMVVVHIVSGNATAEQDATLHAWLGIFLISSGFVALSGYTIGAKGPPIRREDLGRALDSGMHLLLVMLAYAILQSLVRHGLTLAAGGAIACSARFGWSPPLRFDDLGILLPIAIVQIVALLARSRGGAVAAATAALAWMLLPILTAGIGRDDLGGTVVEVLTRRSLTPFYTVSLFVAMGLAGAVLGRVRWGGADRLAAPIVAPLALAAAVLLAMPGVSQPAIGRAYRLLGDAGGSIVTLVYWTIVVGAFIRGCAVPAGSTLGPARRAFALLGRHSLLVFIAHDFLLELDAFAREALPARRGGAAVAVMIVGNLALLALACRGVEGSRRARAVLDGLLLGRSRPAGAFRARVLSFPGLLALAGVLAVYTSSAFARRDGGALLVDDFEGRAQCPKWWTFGSLSLGREPTVDPGHGRAVLAARGQAPGMFAHGGGLYLDRDLGDRRTLALDVRGHGPRSGRIKIELFDDDNGNWEIEKDERSYAPLHDDRLVHELVVDWTGWRELLLPAAVFHDDNPGAGNDVFDPQRDLTSGGLLELQLLFSPTSAAGDAVEIDLDNLRWLP